MNDPLDRARKALQAVRQYQQDWLEHGRDRIYLYHESPEEALDIIVDDLTIEERSLLDDIKCDYDGEPLTVHSSEHQIVDNLVRRGFLIELDPNCHGERLVRPKDPKIRPPIPGNTIAAFIRTHDTVTIELDDGRTIIINAYSHDSYDDEWGKYVPTGYLNVKIE